MLPAGVIFHNVLMMGVQRSRELQEIMAEPFLGPSTLFAIQEYLVTWRKVAAIEALFEGAGIRLPDGYKPTDNSVRRGLIKGYYASLDLTNWSHAKKLIAVIESLLIDMSSFVSGVRSPEDWNREHQEIFETLDELTAYLKHDGYSIQENRLVYNKTRNQQDDFANVALEDLPAGVDLFKHQFPVGLPFGPVKPEFAIIADKGVQKPHFEPKHGVEILTDTVYPNFTFHDLHRVFKSNTLSTDAVKRLLVNMNQTDTEKEFIIRYAKKFGMAQNDVPVLIPQARIQWHSMTKRDLRAEGSKIADKLYRIDFVAFWNNRRYAILIDDIGHFGRKKDDLWLADEESYAKRLKEDRELRHEQWQVFRVSNWEMRNPSLVLQILDDLRELIGFA